MTFRKVGPAPVIAMTAIAILAGCSGATQGGAGGKLEKTSITIDAFGAIDSAGLFIAEQQNLFRQQGLNVKIDVTPASQPAINGQLAGDYDITSADYVTYIDNVLQKKAPLRIIGESSFLQPNVLTLLTKAGSKVTTVQALKGKTVSVNAPQDIGTLLIDSLLSDNDVPLNTVKFNNNVQFPSVATDLGNNSVAAAFAPQPFVSVDAMLDGTQELADLDQGGSTNFPIQGVAVTQKWAQQNPNTLAAFERAYQQGQELADTDRADVEQALEAYLKLAPQAAALISLPDFPTGVDAVRLQRLVDAMVQYGLLGRQYAGFKVSSIIGGG